VRPPAGPPAAIRLGRLHVDALDRAGSIDAIATLIASGRGGRVFTPNLDHVRLADELPAFREAYARAAISIVDGMPLVWASRLFGTPLRERVAGADLVVPLCARAAREGWRVMLLGGAPDSAAAATRHLVAQCGTTIVSTLTPRVELDDRSGDAVLIAAIRAHQPHLVFVALGSPKQEVWIDRVADAVHPAVLIGVGAAFDFVAGRVRRAPAWIGRLGLEWLFRLVHEPGRLWRRYLIAGPRGLWLLLRTPRDEAMEAASVPPTSRLSSHGP